MKNSVLNYGSFVSGKVPSTAARKTQVTKNENLQSEAPLEELEIQELQPLETAPQKATAALVAPAKTFVAADAMEIPTLDQLLNPNATAAKKQEEESAAQKLEEELAQENFHITSTEEEYDPDRIYNWEVPFYDDGRSLGKNRRIKEKPAAEPKAEKAPKEPKAPKEKKEKIKKEKTPKEEVVKEKVVKEKKQKKNKKENVHKVKRPIAVMLIVIISLIVIASIAAVTFFVSKSTTQDVIVSAEESNRTQCSNIAKDFESRLKGNISSVEMFYYLEESVSNNENEVLTTSNKFFEGNDDFAAVVLLDQDKKFINNKFFASNELNPEIIDAYIVQNSDLIDTLVPGKVAVENISPFFRTSAAAVFCSFVTAGKIEKVMFIFSTLAIQENIASNSIYLSYIVNSKGSVIVHPDSSVMTRGEDYSNNPSVAKLMKESDSNSQSQYKDKYGNSVIGGYYRISVGECAAVTEVQTAIITEGVRGTIRRNIFLAIATLAISAIIIWFFALSLSEPLKALTRVTNKISQGVFDTDLINELDVNRKDEIGVLMNGTKNEIERLHTVTRYLNPDVTKRLLRNEIDLKPLPRDITIFFSDIRGFTSISDKMYAHYGNDSVKEIVNFLNDYLGRMINCIQLTNGTIDKFEGDAIMAGWGLLRNPKELDFEAMEDSNPEKQELMEKHRQHVIKDALNSIRASMAMRYSLMEYNKAAEKYTKKNTDSYKPQIRIGMGINSGRATVANIGSEKYKIEHTAIGDAVNLASRTESATKVCGVDLLITEDTYNILKMDYIRCEENNFTILQENLKNEIIVEEIPVTFTVKGKSNQHFYGVVNMPAFDVDEFFKAENTEYENKEFKVNPDCLCAVGKDGPKTLNEVRDLLGIPVPDFNRVKLDESEEKVKIN